MGKWERQSRGLNQIDKLSFMVSGMCVCVDFILELDEGCNCVLAKAMRCYAKRRFSRF